MRPAHPESAVVVGAAVAVAVPGLVLLDVARTASTAIAAAAVVGAVGAAVAAVGLVRGNRFEARLTGAVVAASAVLLAVVGMVLGPPGSHAGGVSWRAVLVAATGVVALFLLRLASRRGVTPRTGGPPYAH